MKVSDYIRRSGHEAIWLMSHALGVSHSAILSRNEFSPEECAKIEAVISRREAGEPLQYILGVADFYGRDFCVGDGVLIPRRDTETLIDAVKCCIASDDVFSFVDWGTGSGCIAVTLLLEFPDSHAYMLEASPDALSYAMKNLVRYGLTDRAEVNRVPESCRVIVSNPPYIPTGEIAGLMREVRDYEPHSALDGGSDGMKYYYEVFTLADKILQPDGYIILEAGNIQQVDRLKSLGRFIREVYDDGNFPRALIFQKE